MSKMLITIGFGSSQLIHLLRLMNVLVPSLHIEYCHICLLIQCVYISAFCIYITYFAILVSEATF